MSFKHKFTLATGTALALTTTLQTQALEEPASFVDALKTADVKLHVRLRYEDVEQAGAADAQATTLLTRLTYSSTPYQGWGLVLEMDDVRELADADYSDGVTNRGTAIIADPEGTELNQAYLSFTTEISALKLGRQRILLDNQRFVGGVGWRQDEQTYDGFSARLTGIDRLNLFYGYLTQVNRIFAQDQDHQHNSHLLNVKLTTGLGDLVGYAYLLDYDVLSAGGALATPSSDTYGLRWQGRFGDGFNYNLEYAQQSSAGDNPADYSADYLLGEAVLTVPLGHNTFSITVGYEVLGSDNGVGFSTPLATAHAFQGWADKFLATPADGIEDAYAGINTQLGAFTLGLRYHQFSAEADGADYGDEINFVAGTKLGPVALTVKYADYSADTWATDTRKLWLMAATTF